MPKTTRSKTTARSQPPASTRAAQQPERDDRAPTLTTPPRASQALPSKRDNFECVLAEFGRTGPEGEPAVVRVMLSDFDGRPILHVRQWVQMSDRKWTPTKMGVTIRLNEIDRTIAALERAKAEMVSRVAANLDPAKPRPNTLTSPGSMGDPGRRLVAPWEG